MKRAFSWHNTIQCVEHVSENVQNIRNWLGLMYSMQPMINNNENDLSNNVKIGDKRTVSSKGVMSDWQRHRHSRWVHRQKPQYFLFAKHVDKIGVRSVMESKLVGTIDKDWNAVRIYNNSHHYSKC